MFSLNAKVITIKMINLNIEIKISIIKIMSSLIFEIVIYNMHKKMVLIKQNITILF